MHDSLSEKILRQIHDCSNIINRGRSSSYIKLKDNTTIGRGQGVLLHILSENDGLTQKELASQLKIRPASLGELVRKLEQNGYVNRRVNEKDKRITNVFITEKGRSVCKDAANVREQSVEAWCSGLSENEKLQLSTLLGKLIDSMEDTITRDMSDINSKDIDSREYPNDINHKSFED